MHYAWIVKRIHDAIAIGVAADRWCLIAGRGLRFDCIGNAIVVTVEIQVVSKAISIRVNGRRCKLIPGSVAIVIGEARRGCFGGVDHTAVVSVGRDRDGVATFI